VKLVGLVDIMFDRYPGDNNTQLEPRQKLYLEPGGSRVIGLPSINIMSFLSAHNTNSAPKRLRDKRKYKDIANAMLSFVSIREQFIPLQRDGKRRFEERKYVMAGPINAERTTELQHELQDALNRFAAKNPGLDNSEAVAACMGLIGNIIASLDNPSNRRSVVTDVERWLPIIVRQADQFALEDRQLN
jgi:hypothetical protein